MNSKFKSWFLRMKLPYWMIYDVDRMFAQRDIEALCYKAYLKGKKDQRQEETERISKMGFKIYM